MYHKTIEIHFYDKNRAAVRLVKSSGELPFAESLFFSLYSTRQLVNIVPSKTISSSLAISLTHAAEALDTLRSAVEFRNVKIIDYLAFTPGKRIFVAELYCDAERANFNVKPKGFGVLARGVDYFAATSVLVLLRHYARTLKEDSELAVLGKTAELIGHTFLAGGLGISNQSAAAESIWQEVTDEVLQQAENKMDQSVSALDNLKGIEETKIPIRFKESMKDCFLVQVKLKNGTNRSFLATEVADNDGKLTIYNCEDIVARIVPSEEVILYGYHGEEKERIKWGEVEDYWWPKNWSGTTPEDDEPTVEKSLSEQFVDLDPETQSKFLQPFFLKYCVDGFAKTMTPAVLEHVPETAQIFQGEEGQKYLTGELGAMIIEGYFAGRLSMGGLPEVHPITLVPNENRDRLCSQISSLWKSLEMAVAEGALGELLADLVTVRINMKGFKEVEDFESLGKYLYVMLLNGVQWAKAEKDIIG